MSDEHRILKAAWEYYEQCCVPPHATRAARVLMRSVFYAGASSVMKHLEEMADLDLSEDDVVDHLMAMRDEIQAFATSEIERVSKERRGRG